MQQWHAVHRPRSQTGVHLYNLPWSQPPTKILYIEVRRLWRPDHHVYIISFKPIACKQYLLIDCIIVNKRPKVTNNLLIWSRTASKSTSEWYPASTSPCTLTSDSTPLYKLAPYTITELPRCCLLQKCLQQAMTSGLSKFIFFLSGNKTVFQSTVPYTLFKLTHSPVYPRSFAMEHRIAYFWWLFVF